MNRFRQLILGSLLGVGAVALGMGTVQADGDGRAGSIEFSDGHKVEGTILLTPGKDFKLFIDGRSQVTFQLDEVKELRFTIEKEAMEEGFYFPDAGQATQKKTGEFTPTRYLKTEVTLSNGKVMEGHLFTTMLYVTTDDTTQKVILLAKQTGPVGQPLAEMIYPTDIRFDTGDASSAGSQIDLTQVSLDRRCKHRSSSSGPSSRCRPCNKPPENRFGPYRQPIPDAFSSPSRPRTASMSHGPSWSPIPPLKQAVETSINDMKDFYDTRTLVGCFADGDDLYALVMMERIGETHGFAADKKPWSLIVLRWKYDGDAKKTTLLNRIALGNGRLEGNSKLPAVLKEAGLLRDISALPAPTPEGTHP